MVKKQVGFQMASYLYPEDYWPQGGGSAKYGKMRSEIETLQEDGWEVIDVRLGSVVQGEGTSTQLNALISLVKYEWVDESVAEPVKATVGRPKKDA